MSDYETAIAREQYYEHKVASFYLNEDGDQSENAGAPWMAFSPFSAFWDADKSDGDAWNVYEDKEREFLETVTQMSARDTSENPWTGMKYLNDMVTLVENLARLKFYNDKLRDKCVYLKQMNIMLRRDSAMSDQNRRCQRSLSAGSIEDKAEFAARGNTASTPHKSRLRKLSKWHNKMFRNKSHPGHYLRALSLGGDYEHTSHTLVYSEPETPQISPSAKDIKPAESQSAELSRSVPSSPSPPSVPASPGYAQSSPERSPLNHDGDLGRSLLERRRSTPTLLVAPGEDFELSTIQRSSSFKGVRKKGSPQGGGKRHSSSSPRMGRESSQEPAERHDGIHQPRFSGRSRQRRASSAIAGRKGSAMFSDEFIRRMEQWEDIKRTDEHGADSSTTEVAMLSPTFSMAVQEWERVKRARSQYGSRKSPDDKLDRSRRLTRSKSHDRERSRSKYERQRERELQKIEKKEQRIEKEKQKLEKKKMKLGKDGTRDTSLSQEATPFSMGSPETTFDQSEIKMEQRDCDRLLSENELLQNSIQMLTSQMGDLKHKYASLVECYEKEMLEKEQATAKLVETKVTEVQTSLQELENTVRQQGELEEVPDSCSDLLPPSTDPCIQDRPSREETLEGMFRFLQRTVLQIQHLQTIIHKRDNMIASMRQELILQNIRHQLLSVRNFQKSSSENCKRSYTYSGNDLRLREARAILPWYLALTRRPRLLSADQVSRLTLEDKGYSLTGVFPQPIDNTKRSQGLPHQTSFSEENLHQCASQWIERLRHEMASTPDISHQNMKTEENMYSVGIQTDFIEEINKVGEMMGNGKIMDNIELNIESSAEYSQSEPTSPLHRSCFPIPYSPILRSRHPRKLRAEKQTAAPDSHTFRATPPRRQLRHQLEPEIRQRTQSDCSALYRGAALNQLTVPTDENASPVIRKLSPVRRLKTAQELIKDSEERKQKRYSKKQHELTDSKHKEDQLTKSLESLPTAPPVIVSVTATTSAKSTPSSDKTEVPVQKKAKSKLLDATWLQKSKKFFKVTK